MRPPCVYRGGRELTECDVDDVRVWDGVERRELRGRADGAVEEDLSVEDGLWRRGRRDLLRPEVRREEVASMCSEVVVDGEAALSEEHVS